MNVVNPTQPDTPDKERLQINITSDVTASPVADATVSISYTGVPDSQLEQLTTDSSGQTETIELAAPPLDYSLNPAIEEQPYSESVSYTHLDVYKRQITYTSSPHTINWILISPMTCKERASFFV